MTNVYFVVDDEYSPPEAVFSTPAAAQAYVELRASYAARPIRNGLIGRPGRMVIIAIPIDEVSVAPETGCWLANVWRRDGKIRGDVAYDPWEAIRPPEPWDRLDFVACRGWGTTPEQAMQSAAELLAKKEADAASVRPEGNQA